MCPMAGMNLGFIAYQLGQSANVTNDNARWINSSEDWNKAEKLELKIATGKNCPPRTLME